MRTTGWVVSGSLLPPATGWVTITSFVAAPGVTWKPPPLAVVVEMPAAEAVTGASATTFVGVSCSRTVPPVLIVAVTGLANAVDTSATGPFHVGIALP